MRSVLCVGCAGHARVNGGRPGDHPLDGKAGVDARRRRAMGDAGFARVNERFTVEKMIAATASVYARVAGTPHVTDTESQPARG